MPRYILFNVHPHTQDELAIRKHIQDALTQSFGLMFAGTPVDILWVASDGSATVVRVDELDAQKVMAAVVPRTPSSNIRLSTVNDSAFLPSLLGSDAAQIF